MEDVAVTPLESLFESEPGSNDSEVPNDMQPIHPELDTPSEQPHSVAVALDEHGQPIHPLPLSELLDSSSASSPATASADAVSIDNFPSASTFTCLVCPSAYQESDISEFLPSLPSAQCFLSLKDALAAAKGTESSQILIYVSNHCKTLPVSSIVLSYGSLPPVTIKGLDCNSDEAMKPTLACDSGTLFTLRDGQHLTLHNIILKNPRSGNVPFPLVSVSSCALFEAEECDFISGSYALKMEDMDSRSTLKNCTISASRHSSIFATNQCILKVENCSIEKPGGHGIEVNSKVHFFAKNLTISNPSRGGIDAEDGCICEVEDCVVTNAGAAGFSFVKNSSIVINNCTSESSGSPGFRIENRPENKKTSLTDCIARNGKHAGFMLDGSASTVALIGCKSFGNKTGFKMVGAWHGLLEDCEASETVSDSFTAGFFSVFKSQPRMVRCRSFNNECPGFVFNDQNKSELIECTSEQDKGGFHLKGNACDPHLKTCSVTRSKAAAGTSNYSAAILVESNAKGRFVDVTISESQRTSVYLDRVSGASFESCVFKGNNTSQDDNAKVFSATSSSGITLTNCTFEDNNGRCIHMSHASHIDMDSVVIQRNLVNTGSRKSEKSEKKTFGTIDVSDRSSLHMVDCTIADCGGFPAAVQICEDSNNQSADESPKLKMTRCRVLGSSASGVFVQSGAAFRCVESEISRSGHDGCIILNGGYRSYLEKSKFSDNGSRGLLVEGPHKVTRERTHERTYAVSKSACMAIDCRFEGNKGKANVHVMRYARAEFMDCTIADGNHIGVLVDQNGSVGMDRCVSMANSQGPNLALMDAYYCRFADSFFNHSSGSVGIFIGGEHNHAITFSAVEAIGNANGGFYCPSTSSHIMVQKCVFHGLVKNYSIVPLGMQFDQDARDEAEPISFEVAPQTGMLALSANRDEGYSLLGLRAKMSINAMTVTVMYSFIADKKSGFFGKFEKRSFKIDFRGVLTCLRANNATVKANLSIKSTEVVKRPETLTLVLNYIPDAMESLQVMGLSKDPVKITLRASTMQELREWKEMLEFAKELASKNLFVSNVLPDSGFDEGFDEVSASAS